MSIGDIRVFSATDADWQQYIDHLNRVNMLHYAIGDSVSNNDSYYFAAIEDSQVIGHISVRRQAILVPASHLSNGKSLHLRDSKGALLYEIFVKTFAVEESYRRQGYGRALQEKVIETAPELNCYQVRSWSSSDKEANYALKISLGYLIQPALYPIPGGEPISGVYFVKGI